MCRVFNKSEFWIFVSFRKYGRVLNIRQDAIMEEFWVFQDSEYATFPHMQALHNFLNMPENGWIMPYDKVLNIPDQRFTGF